MVNNNINGKLREVCKKIISNSNLKYMIGYETGTNNLEVSPCFAHTQEDANKFIFSPFCANNLTVHLVRPLTERSPEKEKIENKEKQRVGIVVKGCDSRALIQLIQENIINRDNLIVIGVVCAGVIDKRKLLANLEKLKLPKDATFSSVELQEDNFIFLTEQKQKLAIPKAELVFEKCLYCKYPTPLIYDVLIGEKTQSTTAEERTPAYESIKHLEALSLQERWDYWKEQFSKCIRCYACRNVCPFCYCKECIADKTLPVWIRSSQNLSENLMFHLMRALHMAGRCVLCEECSRVCPMNIPISTLTKKLEKEVRDMFKYEAGVNMDAKPLFAMFNPEDPEEFIL